MGFFRRRRDDDRPEVPPVDPDDALPMLSRDDARRITELARQSFAEQGIETVPDGEGSLVASDDRRYGLGNLATGAAVTARGDWPGLVDGHVFATLAVDRTPDPQSLDEIRSLVLPRLRLRADLPEGATYPTEVLPGVVALLAVDYPTHVSELLDDGLVTQLGGWSGIEPTALANLRALPPLTHEVVAADPERDEAHVHVLTSDDFFAPSRYLVLDELLPALGVEAPHGLLLVVPHRHLLALHVLAGPDVVMAMQLLLPMAIREFEVGPGPVSPHVYFRPAGGGPAQQVTHADGNGNATVRVEGALSDAFRSLGLVEDH